MCSIDILSLLLERSVHQHNSHLEIDSLYTHTQRNDYLHNMPINELQYNCSAWIPSQTGQPHALVTGCGQTAAGHGFFTHRTEPLCRIISMTDCQRNKQQDWFALFCVCLWYLAGTFRAGVSWVRGRFSIGENYTVIETAYKKRQLVPLWEPDLEMWPEFDFNFTYVHIRHNIVQVLCKGGCNLHNKVFCCRWPPLHNRNTRHRGRGRCETQCRLNIPYPQTCSLRIENERQISWQ